MKIKTKRLVYRLSDGTFWAFGYNQNRASLIENADNFANVGYDPLTVDLCKTNYGLDGDFVWFDVVTTYTEGEIMQPPKESE